MTTKNQCCQECIAFNGQYLNGTPCGTNCQCHQSEGVEDKKKIQSVIDLLKEQHDQCENYSFGCVDCQVGRIVQDLENIRDLS